jgi:hypothetical protein
MAKICGKYLFISVIIILVISIWWFSRSNFGRDVPIPPEYPKDPITKNWVKYWQTKKTGGKVPEEHPKAPRSDKDPLVKEWKAYWGKIQRMKDRRSANNAKRKKKAEEKAQEKTNEFTSQVSQKGLVLDNPIHSVDVTKTATEVLGIGTVAAILGFIAANPELLAVFIL